LRQPFQLVELVRIKLDAIIDQRLAVLVIRTLAGAPVEQLASDVGREQLSRFLILQLVQATSTTAVTQRFPFAAVERQQGFPKRHLRYSSCNHTWSAKAGRSRQGWAEVTIIRSWTKVVLALALALAPAAASAQGMGLNSSDGEAFLNAVKDGDSNKALELANQPGSRVAGYRGYNGDTALHIVTRKRELDWVGFPA
jgi:hypothetical protein